MTVADKKRLPLKTKICIKTEADIVLIGYIKKHDPVWKMAFVKLDPLHPVSAATSGYYHYKDIRLICPKKANI